MLSACNNLLFWETSLSVRISAGVSDNDGLYENSEAFGDAVGQLEVTCGI